jgi:hypothetical protein
MNKLNSPLQAAQTGAFPNDSGGVSAKPAPRLLVLVSNGDVDNVNLTREIWRIAKPQKLEVVLLTLCANFEQEARLRRGLITMAAMIRDETICADFQVRYGANWLTLVMQEWRYGDILICSSEQYIGLRRRLLSQVLSSKLKTSVQIIFASRAPKPPALKIKLDAAFWFGSIGILSVFFWVEAAIAQSVQNWIQTFVLSLCILFEVVLLWIWNSLF